MNDDDTPEQEPRVTTDWCTKTGADTLAEVIEHYWHDKGFVNVQAFVLSCCGIHKHGEGFARPGNKRYPVFGIRSNLVGGLPPRR
jgi:hypothetical protein